MENLKENQIKKKNPFVAMCYICWNLDDYFSNFPPFFLLILPLLIFLFILPLFIDKWKIEKVEGKTKEPRERKLGPPQSKVIKGVNQKRNDPLLLL